MLHNSKTVTPLPGYRRSVPFAEGVAKCCDSSPLLEKIPVFNALRTTRGLFAKASRHGVVRNDAPDLPCGELWEFIPVQTPFDGLMAFRDASGLWGLNETLRKAIAYGKWKNGTDVCKCGKQWVVSAGAMQREYGQNRHRIYMYPQKTKIPRLHVCA